ncbi:MAG: NAD(+) diphosphatase [Thermoanaerobaculia bacterium]
MIPFTNTPVDRAAEKRKDTAWLRARLAAPSTTFIALHEGKPIVRDGALARLSAPNAANPLFLGIDENDAAVFAIESESGEGAEDFRGVILALPERDAALAATARSLFEWHRRHAFCSVCGHASEIAAAGWQRVCPSCSAEHFPRVDPVVIMLPLFEGRCLLGRQFAWPKGRMSALAGFLEPGETIEEACAREVKEEAGLLTTRITYFGSQPWPFPSSLMIGLFAEVASDCAVADGTELEEVRWLSRAEARAMLDGSHPDVLAPSTLGISRHLIHAWADQE